MNAVRSHMKLSEHCPDCGALLVSIPGGTLCPHCGFTDEDPEEILTTPITRLPGRWGEAVRYRLLDEAA